MDGGCLYYVMELADNALGTRVAAETDYQPMALATLLTRELHLPIDTALNHTRGNREPRECPWSPGAGVRGRLPTLGVSDTLNGVSRSFPVILTPQPEGGYFVECPSLPGCYSQGETVEEALDNIGEAILLALEDLEALGQAVPDVAPPLVTEVQVTV